MPISKLSSNLSKSVEEKVSILSEINWTSLTLLAIFTAITLVIFHSITKHASEENWYEETRLSIARPPVSSFIARGLSTDEFLLISPKLHWINWVLPIAFIFFTFVLFRHITLDPHMFLPLLSFIIVSIYLFLSLFSIEMACTNKRVINKSGFIAIRTDELRIEKIQSIDVNQSIAGRLLRYGDLTFMGTGPARVRFKNIKHPWCAKRSIEEYLSQHYSNHISYSNVANM